mgnify:CR=1 FL=1
MTKHNDSDDDGPDGAAAAQTIRDGCRKGEFDFSDNAVDLIGMFLDADIRRARDKVHAQIENGAIQGNGIVSGGRQSNTQHMTQAAQKVAKTVVNLQAIQKQAQRSQRRR